jgi:hypothetical protein
MEQATKKDLQHLKAKLVSINLKIEQNADKMQDATLDEFMELRRSNDALFYRKVATNDAISRITKKNFSKPSPETHCKVANISTNPNRFIP